MIKFQRYSQAQAIAESLLDTRELLDQTSTVPHIQLTRSVRYLDIILVDALYRGIDGKLYWYITTNWDTPYEDCVEIEFEKLPLQVIEECLDSIMRRLGLKPDSKLCPDEPRHFMVTTLEIVIDGLKYISAKINNGEPVTSEDWKMSSEPMNKAMETFIAFNLKSALPIAPIVYRKKL